MKQAYYFQWSSTIELFLAHKGIASVTGDADITHIFIEGNNDTNFVNLILEYAQWLKESEHDMTINPNADGSRYHQG